MSGPGAAPAARGESGAVSPPHAGAGLLLVAAFGFLIPNGIFVYWLVHEWSGVAAVLSNHLAVAFILDAFIAMMLLAWSFARRPIGRYGWPWFVALSLLGGLGFSLPVYWWLNARTASRRS